MSVSLPNQALVRSLAVAARRRCGAVVAPFSLSPFFSNDRPFGGDTAARFLSCLTTLAGRAGRSGPDCNLGAGSGAADGRTEGVRVSEPFLRWAAVLDYVSSHFASRGRAVLPSMHVRVPPLRTLLSDCGVKNSVCPPFTPFRESAAVGRSFPIPDPTAAHVAALLYDGRTGSRV